MIRLLLIGLWATIVALGSAYATATMQAGGTAEPDGEHSAFDGLEFRRPAPITVPMITDGRLIGYVVARVIYTADAHELAAFPIDPDPFVLDEAFRRIYHEGNVEFDRMSKSNLQQITSAVKKSVNERLGAEIVHDVLVDELSFVDKKDLDKPNDPEEAAAAAHASADDAGQDGHGGGH